MADDEILELTEASEADRLKAIWLVTFEVLVEDEGEDEWLHDELRVAGMSDGQPAIERVKQHALSPAYGGAPVKGFRVRGLKLLAEVDIDE